MISSSANPKVKQIMQWQGKVRERRKDGVFLAEGAKMFEEAPADWIREVYLSETMAAELFSEADAGKGAARYEEADAGEIEARRKGSGLKIHIREKLRQIPYETVKDDTFVRMSDTHTPQGILTVLRQPAYQLEALLQHPNPLFLVIENLQDPGNLGTIIRTGEGAGVSGVFLSSGTVDAFHPKTIRATMGSVYRVPLLYVTDMSEIMTRLRERGVRTYAAVPISGIPAGTQPQRYDDCSFGGPAAFLIGNEGNGLTKELCDSADSFLTIPMEGRVESLNAAVCAAVLLYEAHRQRRRSASHMALP